MRLTEFGYTLPEELIAQYPEQKRDHARLLVVRRDSGRIEHALFKDLPDILPSQSHLILNNSKVIPARLLGTKPRTGGQVEVFLLKKLRPRTYEAMLRPLKKIQEGEPLIFPGGIEARLLDRAKRIVEFNREDVVAALMESGHIPLPPYIKRKDEALDKEFYQTVYARHGGSVAAPTAGLHFTRDLLVRLKAHGVQQHMLTLHTNYGTFKPVETEDIREHPMHSETYSLSPRTWDEIQKGKARREPLVAVGTTSCRVLESVASGAPLRGETKLFIYPGYTFKMVDILITNFHLPFSTLLMLVYAFGGMDLMKRAYAEAIQAKYRFYSYGDGMVIV